jgi:hypothetical protein
LGFFRKSLLWAQLQTGKKAKEPEGGIVKVVADEFVFLLEVENLPPFSGFFGKYSF